MHDVASNDPPAIVEALIKGNADLEARDEVRGWEGDVFVGCRGVV